MLKFRVVYYPFIHTFVARQYSLGVKRDEMRKLEEIAAAEEKKLEMAEQYLEEDAAMFDEFLKQNDQNSVDAIRAWVFCSLELVIKYVYVRTQKVERGVALA